MNLASSLLTPTTAQKTIETAWTRLRLRGTRPEVSNPHLVKMVKDRYRDRESRARFDREMGSWARGGGSVDPGLGLEAGFGIVLLRMDNQEFRQDC
jgi:hypothetical protein